MKLIIILTVATILQASASGYAQKITLSERTTSLKEIFQEISRQTGYEFLYDTAILKEARPVNVNFNNTPLEKVLKECFSKQSLTYVIKDKTIIVNTKGQFNAGKRDSLLLIRGRIFDTNEPPIALPGVTVKVKGATTGVASDTDGYFTIKANKNDILVFSLTGFKSYEYTVTKALQDLNVSLKEDIGALDEVVVMGVTEMKRKHMASSIASVNVASNLGGKPVTTISQALQGGVTGIQVSQASALPGGDAATIKIRGIGTIGNSNPLVLVDGIPSDMNYLDPVTIESVTVLKDAAAAAVYGARAGNGVIVITTKRGSPGKIAVSYDSYLGVQSPSVLPRTVDAPTYMNMLTEAQQNDGKAITYTQSDIQKTADGIDPINYPNTDWVDLLINKAAPITSHSIAVSGGSSVARFALTGNYQFQEGIIPVSNANRYTIRANTTVTLSKSFIVNLDMLALKRGWSQPNRPSNFGGNRLLEDIYRTPPTILPKYPEKAAGVPVSYGRYLDIVNPLAYAELGGSRRFESGETSLNLQPKWEIFKNFNLRGQFSFKLGSDATKDTGDGYRFFDYNTGALLQTWALQRATARARSTYYYLGGSADYTLDVGNHHFYSVAGYTQEETNSGDFDVYSMLSGYFKVNYSYKDKYLFEGTMRVDGSSRFGPGNKFGKFPSMALGWNVHNEDFMQNLKMVNSLKLRASYGQMGNENIGLYKYQTLISSANAIESTYGNPDITWETVNMLNVGMDLSLFKNHSLDITFDYYNKQTKDIILTPPLPFIGGFEGAVPVNAGEVRNRGWELSLNYYDKINKDISFSIKPGVTYNKNTVISLTGYAGGSFVSGSTINQVGRSISSVYGYRTNGLLQAGDFDNAGNARVPILAGQKPGDIRFLDINNDGIVSPADQGLIGNPVPEYNFFSNFQINYKKLSLEFLLQGTSKSDAALLGMFAYPLDLSFDGGIPTNYYSANYWTPNRTDARFPRLTTAPANNKLSSDFWFQNGAYLRVKYIQLGYDFNTPFIKHLGMNSLRLYANAQNPFTFTSMELTDPESRGNQYTYGIVKLYTFGVSIKF